MQRAEWTAAQRYRALILVCVVGVFNLVDRQVMTILLEPIKHEFDVSDTSMGLLAGSFFALFYSLSSVPFAQAADRFPRRLVIGGALIAWSLLTSLGGFAGSFAQLAATRIGVAIGEAGSVPATYSIMADLYPLRHRAKAFSCYSAATSIGIGGAVVLGGWLVQAVGWRMTLVLVGVPGLLLALMMLTLFREPARGMSDALTQANGERPGVVETLRHLWRIRTFPFIVLLAGFGGTTGYGLLTWGPSFLIRAHGLKPAEVGLWFGSVSIIALVLGQLITGALIDLAARIDLRAYMWFAAGGLLLAIPCGLMFTMAADWRIGIAGFGMLSFLIAPHNMCSIVLSQTLAPPRMRATAAMIIGLGTALLGTGMGPLVVGALNDIFAPLGEAAAIRASLSVDLAFLALASGSALIAARFVRADHARLHARQPNRPVT